MLTTFSCDAYENITLFGHVAEKLLKMMGHSGVIPTAILADDVNTALNHLEAALAREVPSPRADANDDKDEDIALAKRAVPIIALLKAAVKAHCDVIIHH